MRSLLFVPGDRPERFGKAAGCGADAVILDLEDSVAPGRKDYARAAVAEWLAGDHGTTLSLVRINPLDQAASRSDVEALRSRAPAGLVLPKAEGARSIRDLAALIDGPVPPVLPIATETPAAIFTLGTFREVADRLLGVTWGAEDLPAAIGAIASREEDGRYTPPYELARSLTLFSAHAAGVAAIETVFPKLDDADALATYVGRARRDGFTAMMALHPKQVAIINEGFAATAGELAAARAIVEAFAADGDRSGALKLDGRMVDLPHLRQARRLLARAERHGRAGAP